MRFVVLSLASAALLVPACDPSSDDASAPTVSADEAAPSANPEAKSNAKAGVAVIDPADLQSPCASISAAFVAETFGWKRATEGQPSEMNDGRMKRCSFDAVDGSVGSFSVTVTVSDARTIENGYLARAFETDLSRDDGRISFEETTPVLGDQTLVAHASRGSSNLYQLRWRVGDAKDHLLEFRAREPWDMAEVEAKLRAVAAKL
ncbi:MAG: hypothetical protein AAGA54_01480 [Myxococcota bacterium]